MKLSAKLQASLAHAEAIVRKRLPTTVIGLLTHIAEQFARKEFP